MRIESANADAPLLPNLPGAVAKWYE